MGEIGAEKLPSVLAELGATGRHALPTDDVRAVLREFETLHAFGGDAVAKSKRSHDILAGVAREFRNPVLDNISHFILRMAYCKTSVSLFPPPARCL